jgi:hypothetical protein
MLKRLGDQSTAAKKNRLIAKQSVGLNQYTFYIIIRIDITKSNTQC